MEQLRRASTPEIYNENERVEKHECEVGESRLLFKRLAPYASLYERGWHGGKNLFRIERKNPLTRVYFRSLGRVYREKGRHAVNHPFTIHPFSRFVRYKEYLQICVWSTLFTLDPYMMTSHNDTIFGFHYFDEVDYTKVVLDCYLLFDILFNFFIGYYKRKEQRVELRLSRTILHYTFTFFLIDLLGNIYYLTLVIWPLSQTTGIYLTLFPLIRIVGRMRSLARNIDTVLESWRISDFARKSILFVTVLAFLVNAWTAVQFLMPLVYGSALEMEPTNFRMSIQKLLSRHHLFTFLCLLGNVFQMSTNQCITDPGMFTRLSLSLSHMIGYVLLAGMCATLLQYFINVRHERRIYKVEVHSCLRVRPWLGDAQKKRFIRYFNDYRLYLRKRLYAESPMLLHLDRFLVHYSRQEFLKQVRLFANNNVPMPVRNAIMSHMEFEVYLAEDCILDGAASNHQEDIYFVFRGTVGVYIEDEEMLHLEDGIEFGNEFISLRRRNQSDVALGQRLRLVAIEVCELYRISKVQLMKDLVEYPLVLRNLENLTNERLDLYKKNAPKGIKYD